MAIGENLQDFFLNETRREHQLVTVFLMNGFQMKGVVTGFDSFVVCLVSEGRQQMIYKHAISTIVPSHPVRLKTAEAVLP
ncbi:MAG: RNA chaperone Hfq [Oscillospiraceae bacterium]|jgi:host factor-I protein|nr:RNA chaperone Hfq [Oscillospiraceae bacterium]